MLRTGLPIREIAKGKVMGLAAHDGESDGDHGNNIQRSGIAG